MKIDATQTNETVVDITPEGLSSAIIECSEISVSDMVHLVRKKFMNLVVSDDKLYIKDGMWYKLGVNHAGANVAYQGHRASDIEIEVLGAIEALDAVLVIGKLKGNKWYTK